VAVDGRPAGAVAVAQASQAVGHEALPPQTDLVVVHPHQLADVPIRHAVGGQQDDPGSLGGPGLNRVRPHPPLQLGPVPVSDHKRR